VSRLLGQYRRQYAAQALEMGVHGLGRPLGVALAEGSDDRQVVPVDPAPYGYHAPGPAPDLEREIGDALIKA
jgi:hypothetical protein